MLGGSIAFFAIHTESFNSLDEKLLAETKALEKVEAIIEEEINSAESNMTSLLKINREYRKELEQMEEGSEGARDELSFLSPKIKILNEELETVKKELNKADEEINQVKLKSSSEIDKVEPLLNQKEETLGVLEEVSLAYTNAEENWRKLDQEFASLSRVRQAAQETYQNAVMPLMEEIVPPFEIFYGDSIEVEVENISEKEKGFFAKVGLEQGMRSGFVFLIKSDEDWNEMPEYITCTLAEKNYSFMKILHLLDDRDAGTFKVGEKLTLIRSAELTNADDPSDVKEEISISQTDPQ